MLCLWIQLLLRCIATDWVLEKKRGPQSISKNVAGNGTKIHVILAKDEPISIQLTGANVHDSEPVIPMLSYLKNTSIKRFVADKGYDDDKIRSALNEINVRADIPPRKNRKEYRYYDNTIYKWRWRVEAFFGKIKEHRRLALRVDKLDVTFNAFIALALIKNLVC